MNQLPFRTKALVASAGLAVSLLSVIAVHQIGVFRTSVADATRAIDDTVLADELITEYLELQSARRAFRLSGDASFLRPRLDAWHEGRDAFSHAQRAMAKEPRAVRPSPRLRPEDAYLFQLASMVGRRLARIEVLAARPPGRKAAPAELDSQLRDDEAKMILARRLIAAMDDRVEQGLLADDPRTPWDERGAGALAAIVALASVSLLSVIVGFRTLLDEIGGRRSAEAEAREGQRRLEQILDATPDLVFLKDSASRFVWANRAYRRFYGVSPEWRADRDAPAVAEGELKRFELVNELVFRDSRVVDIPRETATRRDGVPRTFHTIKAPVFDDAGRPGLLVGFARDITDRVEDERRLQAAVKEIADAQRLLRRTNQDLENEVNERTEQLLKSQETLRQAQKMEAVGRLAGGVAHDFNNILTVIQGYAAFLTGHDDALVRSDAREIQDAVERAAGVTRQLLQFGRRRLREDQRPLDLNEAVASVERLLVRVIGETVRVETRLDAAGPWASAEPADLEQVLLNLAVNARDAMPRGGRVLIETGVMGLFGDPALADGRYACVTVSDEGDGIAPELQSKIFEPFFTTKGPDKGTGLGLATVYAIARRLGGDARVESAPGQGARFTVLLPLAAAGADEKPVPREPSLEREKAAARPGAVVLLVEDQDTLRRMLARALRAGGYAVIEAGDAAQALLETADPSRRVDVLLSDVVMPGMRGPELAATLLSERPALKALLMSGYLDDAGAPVELPAGVPLLRKPVAPAAVVAAVEAALSSPAAVQAAT